MTDEIKNNVFACLRTIQGLEEREINERHNLSVDLDMDSLDHVEFIMAIEDAFDVQISDDDWVRVETVADAIALVVDKLA